MLLKDEKKFNLSVKKFLKLFIVNSGGLLFGIFNNLFLRKTLTVFVYHDVSDNPSEFSRTYNLNVSLEVFDYQINFIKNNFDIISPADLLENRISPKAALITFDDGFRSYFKNAIPILEKYKVPSIIFLNMEPVKGYVFWSGLITYLCEKREDFRDCLKRSLSKRTDEKSLFLFCSKNLVDSYIKKTGKSLEEEISQFVGEFATEKDLVEASVKPLVFFGNHLFNHHVPLLMSDEDLLESFLKNAKELKKYPNYIDMFAFPFGQPETCYNEMQVSMLLERGAKKVFSSAGRVNRNISSLCLDRIALTFFQDSASKIWFQIVRGSCSN